MGSYYGVPTPLRHILTLSKPPPKSYHNNMIAPAHAWLALHDYDVEDLSLYKATMGRP
jgi:hypothetical protein